MRTGVPGFQGYRLQQAREGLALSQTSLADLVDVSKQAISQYEKGADSPSGEVFDKLRKTLKHDAQFFLKPRHDSLSTNICFYRSLASTTKTARNKAEVWKMWSRELIAHVLEFVEFPNARFPSFNDLPSDPNLLGMDRIETIAMDVREHWKLGEGPITNLVETAENSGAVVFRYGLDAETLDALSEWLQPENFPLVILNADKSVAVRSRLDLAHELGHMFLHSRMAEGELRHSDVFRLVEDQAFRFGAALLLPEHSFLEDLYSVSLDALLALKLKWKVSVAMMIERLKNLNIVTPDQYRRLRINYSARQWNKEEPYDREIEIEQPQFLGKAIMLMLESRFQTIDQFSANTGFSRDWVERLLNLSPDLISPKPRLRLVSFQRPA
jgi:Zn-dependent peptidase ImmA (M78 family)/transcriptional regulator with XRE-family HTH domain